MTTYAEWKAMWDKSGPWPVITHADALLLLLGHIAALEIERDRWRQVAAERQVQIDWWAATAPIPDPVPGADT